MQTSDLLQGFQADEALRGLYKFQRDAVEHAFQRLYIAPDSTRRFLVADEVGLGKTMIARGILAKALEHLRDKVDRIDVIYICSNLGIARQNISRLNPIRDFEFSDAERITLLPIHLKDIASNKLNFVAFTPSTSLQLSSSLGKMKERILLHEMMRSHWDLSGTGPMNVLQGGVRTPERFRDAIKAFRNEQEISEDLQADFCKLLDQEEADSKAAERPSLRKRFLALAESLRRARPHLSEDARRERTEVVGALRGLLARSCIGALEPDLVILDEFQRFKDLLGYSEDGSLTDAAELAQQLFNWSSGSDATRVLLLSATPYKAYSLQHELADDDHYADFIRTVEFLDGDPKRTRPLKSRLADYQKELYQLHDGGPERLRPIKRDIEQHLRRVMSRTERLGSAEQHNGMLRTVLAGNLRVDQQDLTHYVRARALTDALDVGDAIEYWKSAAYPLNFMEGYQFRKALDSHVDNGASERVLNALKLASKHQLDFDAIAKYDPLSVPNARLRYLLEDLHAEGAHQALWLPPSMPPYELGGVFQAVRPSLTKRLVFSAWHLVPRSLATLLSYDLERVAMKGDDPDAVNTEDFRKARRGLLKIGRTEERLTGLPLFTLLYPSRFLADLCDPRKFVRAHDSTKHSIESVLSWAEERVRAVLLKTLNLAGESEAGDEAFYWVAPVLLDLQRFPKDTVEWWEQDHLDIDWVDTDEGSDDVDTAWGEHVGRAKEIVRQRKWLKGKAPHDLPRVLALIGLAGPATAALRGLLRVQPPIDGANALHQRNAAALIGGALRGLFNRPEAMAIIRRGSRDPYWKQVLRYSADGCLGGVLEEYIHLLHEAEAPASEDEEDVAWAVADKLVEAVGLRASNLRIDRFEVDDDRRKVSVSQQSLRALFAVRFGSEKTEDEKQIQREGSTREAFNSPFWPFVLVSTSVGQEGLDFHRYCHAVVHWNLPSNPVDVEQREGRVQRYKGHAVRKNVGSRFGASALSSTSSDAWEEAFGLASREAPPGDRGLHPRWLYPLDDGAYIERHIPLFPLSRDELRLQDLVRSLAAYRMVFGQPRQDELLEYLLKAVPPQDVQRYVDVLRVNLAPPPYD